MISFLLFGYKTQFQFAFSIEFDVINVNVADVTVDSVTMLVVEPVDDAWFREITVGGNYRHGYPVLPDPGGAGFGERKPAPMYDPEGNPLTVKANAERMVTIGFADFRRDSLGATVPYNFYLDTLDRFIFKFSDGSEITVEP